MLSAVLFDPMINYIHYFPWVRPEIKIIPVPVRGISPSVRKNSNRWTRVGKIQYFHTNKIPSSKSIHAVYPDNARGRKYSRIDG